MDAKPVVLLAALLAAPNPPAPGPRPIIAPAALRAHIAVLASDAFQGRAPGTPGGLRAERYVLDQFRRAGLRPGMNGLWTQPVALATRVADTAALRVTVGAASADVPAPQLYAVGRTAVERVGPAPLVFVGHAISSETGRDDLSGVDLTGAVALMLGENSPEGTPPIPERRRMLAARGAAAILVIAGETRPWPELRASFGEGRTGLAAAPMARIEGFVSHAAADRMLEPSGTAVDALAREAAGADFRAHPIAAAEFSATTTIRRFGADNIVGMIRGSRAPGEAVVLTAHWDHLGICRPRGQADRICNGAVDNASGVAALIEIARQLAHGAPPPRSVYFVATTAEELGLLGAHVFVGAPPLARSGIVAELNLDTVAIAPAGAPVAMVGRGRPALDRVVDEVARAAGRAIDDDTDADVFAQRQDGWEFARLGVPAIMVGGAFSDLARFQAYIAGPYHKPQDDLAHLPPLDGAAEDASLHVALVRALADPARYSP